MPDEIDLLTKWMGLPETNQAVFRAHLDECMSDTVTTATNKAVAFVMNEVSDERR